MNEVESLFGKSPLDASDKPMMVTPTGYSTIEQSLRSVDPNWRAKLPKWGKFPKRFQDENGNEVAVGGQSAPSHETIPTRDKRGRPNGYLLPLWNALTSDYRPEQVYLTAVLPGTSKGPHLHGRRCGYFFCIEGNVEFVMRGPDGEYEHVFAGTVLSVGPVEVPAGIACEIRCIGAARALLLNMPTPAWSAEDQDEQEVLDWRPDA